MSFYVLSYSNPHNVLPKKKKIHTPFFLQGELLLGVSSHIFFCYQSIPMVHQNEREHQKMREIHLQWYIILRKKMSIWTVFPQIWGNTIHNFILMSSFFYLHNSLLLFDNLYFMHKQNINTKHNFISIMYIMIKLLKI